MNRETKLMFTQDLGSDRYIVRDGALSELVNYKGELHIVTGEWRTMVYSEHLDGPMLSRADAEKMYPEYFI